MIVRCMAYVKNNEDDDGVVCESIFNDELKAFDFINFYTSNNFRVDWFVEDD